MLKNPKYISPHQTHTPSHTQPHVNKSYWIFCRYCYAQQPTGISWPSSKFLLFLLFFFFLLASKDTFLHLEQESANYSQRAKFGPPTRKWSCFGTQSSAYILPLAAFGFTKQSWVVAREILWPAILKYVLSGPTQKKFANPWSRATNIEIQGRSLMSPPTPVPHSLIQLISISSKFYLLNSSSVLFLSLFLLSLRPSLGPYQFYPHYYNILTGLPAIIFDHLKAISTLVSIN